MSKDMRQAPTSWWTNDAGGPLAAAADAFVRWRGSEPAPGAEALRWLADELDAFAHDTDAPPSDDERFVEGGGALLAMIFVSDRGACHAQRGSDHRILLGQFGSFDPFGAIDAALDDEDPVAALRARVVAAEAELEGTGPVARVVRAFAAAMHAAPQPRSIRERFELDVTTNDGIEVDLRRIADSVGEQGERALDEAVAKIVALLPGNQGEAEQTLEALLGRLIPRLVPRAFLRELDDERQTRLAHEALAGELCVALQVRGEGRARYVRENELEDGFTRYLAAALTNLARGSEGARFATIETERGPLVMARTGDGLDSARLLLPTLAEVLGAELGIPCLVSAPHRDTLLAARDDDDGAALLAERSSDLAARAPHKVSDECFRLDADGTLTLR